jgi:hypothetical protein
MDINIADISVYVRDFIALLINRSRKCSKCKPIVVIIGCLNEDTQIDIRIILVIVV